MEITSMAIAASEVIDLTLCDSSDGEVEDSALVNQSSDEGSGVEDSILVDQSSDEGSEVVEAEVEDNILVDQCSDEGSLEALRYVYFSWLATWL